MPAYRHYRLDGAGKIIKAEWIEADCDDEAVHKVRELGLPAPSEIWNADRRVAIVGAAGPSSPLDEN